MRISIYISLLFLFTAHLSKAQVNERLNFDLKFGIIKGGEVVFTASDTLYNDSPHLKTTLHGYTTGFANVLYEVNDRFESILNNKSLLPVKSVKNLHEKDFRFYNEVLFYHSKDSALSQKSGWHKVDNQISDVAALMFNLRKGNKLDNLKLNEVVSIPFWDTDRWYYLEFKYTGNERIKTPMGKLNCLRIEPLGIYGKHFLKRNPMNIWISDDSNKYPVLMELNFNIGSVKCVLTSVDTRQLASN